MKTDMTILDLIRDNQLAAALEAGKQTVRDNPTDIEARSILCQLFCFSGDWERADNQLATIAEQDSEMQLGVGLIRQLMRAEVAREQFFTDGRTPELVAEPSEAMQALLRALIAVRDQSFDEVSQHVEAIKDNLPVVSGEANGVEFDFARDLDDFMSGFFEVLTTNGKYFLIPFENVTSITFRESERLQDQIWRSANIEVEGGLDGEVYIPTRYSRHLRPVDDLSDALIMGGETEWIPLFEDGPVVGQGQKMFVFGDNAYTIMELNKIEFNNAEQES